MYAMSDGIYPEFLTFIKDLFFEDKEQLLECVNYIIIGDAIADEKIFSFLQKFLSDFFESDENLKSKFMRKILLFEYNGYFNPLKIVLEKSNINHVRTVYKLYEEYDICVDEITKMLKSNCLIITLFRHITNENYEIVSNFLMKTFENNLQLLHEILYENCLKNFSPLQNEFKKFQLFEKFTLEIFRDNKLKAKECIKHIWFGQSDMINLNPIAVAVNNGNSEELNFAIKMYKNYSDDVDEIQEKFITNEVSTLFFTYYMSDEMSKDLKQFLLEIFDSDIKNLKAFIKMDDMLMIIKNKEQFEFFENFIFEYFKNNEFLAKDFLTKILYNDCNGYLVEIDEDMPVYQYERIQNIYIKYKNPWKEISQKISIFQKIHLIF